MAGTMRPTADAHLAGKTRKRKRRRRWWRVVFVFRWKIQEKIIETVKQNTGDKTIECHKVCHKVFDLLIVHLFVYLNKIETKD